MTIDLKWALPFVMPFVLLAMVRALFWLAGAELIEPEAYASLCFILGVFCGWFIMMTMHDDGIRWTVRIGKDADNE